MAFESILFLSVVAVMQAALLFLLVRSGPRDASRILIGCLPFGLALGFWFVRVAARDLSVVGGLLAIGVVSVAVYSALDREARKREGLMFAENGICSFRERGASGRSCDTALMRLGRARGVLLVTVTEKELWIRPSVPFLMFARVWGLVHRVPLVKIHQMERLVGPHANVRLEYTGEDGWCHCVELRLKNPAAFVEAVRDGQLEEAR